MNLPDYGLTPEKREDQRAQFETPRRQTLPGGRNLPSGGFTQQIEITRQGGRQMVTKHRLTACSACADCQVCGGNCPVCGGEGKSPITWEGSIGLWYGYGADGSMWVVSLPEMTAKTWQAEGPDGFSGTGARSAAAARLACEVEYRKRKERLAQSPQARLRALVEQWREQAAAQRAEVEEWATEYERPTMEAHAEGYERHAQELSALITEVYGDGQ